jgi:hypothetical protein
VIATRLSRVGIPTHRLDAAAILFAVAGVTALALVRSPSALALVCFVWGVGTGSNWVLVHSALQRHASDGEIGRAGSGTRRSWRSRCGWPPSTS